MHERIEIALNLLSQAQGILDELVHDLPEDEGEQLCALPSPRDILRDAGDKIGQVVEDLEVF